MIWISNVFYQIDYLLQPTPPPERPCWYEEALRKQKEAQDTFDLGDTIRDWNDSQSKRTRFRPISELTTTSRSVKQIDRLVKTRSNCYRWMIHFPMALLHCEELNLDCYSTPPDPKGGIKLKSIEIKMRWTVARLKEIKETFGVWETLKHCQPVNPTWKHPRFELRVSLVPCNIPPVVSQYQIYF